MGCHMMNELQPFERKIVPPAYRPLLRIRGKNRTQVVPLGPVHTWLMHWDPTDERTVPCVVGACQMCQRYVTKRPLSYCAIAHRIGTGLECRWSPAILEVPLTTGLELAKLTDRPLYLYRPRPKGPVEIIVHEGPFSLSDVRCFDIVPSLMRLWRISPNAQLRLLSYEECPMWNVAQD